MALYLHGTQIANYSDGWDLLKAAGDRPVPELQKWVGGLDFDERGLLSEFKELQTDDDTLQVLIDHAIRVLGG